MEHSSQPPDPWAGYKLCLQDLPDCSHVLVIQDDAIPAVGFTDVLPTIAAENPDRPVCLWMSAMPAACAARARKAYGRQRYVPLGATPFVPLVAVLWPRHLPAQLLNWSQNVRSMTRADDGNIARWARAEKIEFMVTVPSLVEHDDFTPTVKGGRPETQGRDRGRVAMLLASDARDWLPST